MTRLATRRSRNKYNARKTIRDGHVFDSAAEADYYIKLKGRLMAGEISNLRLQPKFVLLEAFTDSGGKRQRAITYTADFAYDEADGAAVVAECKGFETRDWVIRKKLFLYRYRQYRLEVIK